MKYDYEEMHELMYTTGLWPNKLSKLLDVPVWDVLAYLVHGREKINPTSMMRLDAAVEIMREIVKRDRVDRFMREFVESMESEIQRRVKLKESRRTDNACQMICFIITNPDENEFMDEFDPLMNGGLENYSVEEFWRREKEKIKQYY